MATHEHEITEPVELCEADGRTLSPAARGWSRTPVLTANLRGGWGRTKRWDYWAVLAPGLSVAVTYADVDYLGMATVWWADLRTGISGGHEAVVPGARGISLPDRPGTAPLRYRSKALDLELTDDADGTSITARWTEPGDRPASLDLRIGLPADHESLNVVIPWSDRRFQAPGPSGARPAGDRRRGPGHRGRPVDPRRRVGRRAW